MKCLNSADPDGNREKRKKHTEEELEALTVAKLKALAQQEGIRLEATTKAGMISEILEAQESK